MTATQIGSDDSDRLARFLAEKLALDVRDSDILVTMNAAKNGMVKGISNDSNPALECLTALIKDMLEKSPFLIIDDLVDWPATNPPITMVPLDEALKESEGRDVFVTVADLSFFRGHYWLLKNLTASLDRRPTFPVAINRQMKHAGLTISVRLNDEIGSSTEAMSETPHLIDQPTDDEWLHVDRIKWHYADRCYAEYRR